MAQNVINTTVNGTKMGHNVAMEGDIAKNGSNYPSHGIFV